MTAVCQAKQPGPFPRMWLFCGEPATLTCLYSCSCGLHSRTGSSCDAHRPAPGDVGCSQCWDLRHECPMTFTAVMA